MNWNKKLQKGMSFLEVVVAMLVIGVALAGSLAMIQASNRFALTAEYTSIAQQKAQDLIDKMRVNTLAADQFVTSDVIISVNDSIIDYSNLYKSAAKNTKMLNVKNTAPNMSCLKSATCSEQEFANAEFHAWLVSLEQELSSAVPMIQRVKSPQSNTANVSADNKRDNEFVISIMWKLNHKQNELEDDGDNSGDNTNIQGISVPFTI